MTPPPPTPSPTTADWPLALTIIRIDASLPFTSVRLDPASDVPTVADLANGSGFRDLVGVLGRFLETGDPDIPAALIAMGFPMLVASVALTAWLRDRRVPDLAPEHTGYRFTDYAYPSELVLRSPRFVAMPDDPAAGHPDVDVVADEDALLDVLRARLAEHIEVALEAFRAPGVRVSLPTMRRSAREAIMGELCALCERLGRIDDIPTLATLIFQRGDPSNPLFLRRLPVVALNPTRSGRLHPDIKCTTCCLRFRIPGRDPCPACPNQPEADRERRFAEWAATLD